MKDWVFHYPNLFWEKENHHIKELSPKEFSEYLNTLRAENSIDSQSKLREIIRKMVERGSCFEGTLFLLPEEVKTFLEKEKIWVLDERREPLWKRFANLPKDFPLKRLRDGKTPHNARS